MKTPKRIICEFHIVSNDEGALRHTARCVAYEVGRYPNLRYAVERYNVDNGRPVRHDPLHQPRHVASATAAMQEAARLAGWQLKVKVGS